MDEPPGLGARRALVDLVALLVVCTVVIAVMAHLHPLQQLVPGADHFVVLNIATPTWATGKPVATIGDHTFYRVSRL